MAKDIKEMKASLDKSERSLKSLQEQMEGYNKQPFYRKIFNIRAHESNKFMAELVKEDISKLKAEIEAATRTYGNVEGYTTPGTSPGPSARSDASAGVPFSAGYSPDNSARSNSSASTDSSYPSSRGFGAYPSQSSDSSYPSQREVNYPSGAPDNRAPTQPGPDYPSRQPTQDSARHGYGPYTSQQSPPIPNRSVGADYPSQQNYHQNPRQAYATTMDGQTPHARPDAATQRAAVEQARGNLLKPNAAPANPAAQNNISSATKEVRAEGQAANAAASNYDAIPPGPNNKPNY